MDVQFVPVEDCPACNRPMEGLVFDEIPDGATRILTNFRWRCLRCEREVPAALGEMCVDARRRSVDQVQIKPARIYGEDGR